MISSISWHTFFFFFTSQFIYLVSGVRFTSPKALEHTVQSEYCSWLAKKHSGHDHIAIGTLAPSIFIEKYLHIDHYAINCFNSIFTQKKKLRTLHHDKGITVKGNFSSFLSVSPNFHKQRKFSDWVCWSPTVCAPQIHCFADNSISVILRNLQKIGLRCLVNVLYLDCCFK